MFPVAWAQWEMKVEFRVEEDVAKVGFDIIHSSSKNKQAMQRGACTNALCTAEFTRVYFDAKSETVVVDRSCSTSLHGVRTCPEEAPHTLFLFRRRHTEDQAAEKPMVEALEFHVVYDSSVVQVFANERTALTTRVYPAAGTSTGIRPFLERTRHGSCKGFESWASSLVVWPLSLPV